MVRMAGIEPAPETWKDPVIPFHHTRFKLLANQVQHHWDLTTQHALWSVAPALCTSLQALRGSLYRFLLASLWLYELLAQWWYLRSLFWLAKVDGIKPSLLGSKASLLSLQHTLIGILLTHNNPWETRTPTDRIKIYSANQLHQRAIEFMKIGSP